MKNLLLFVAMLLIASTSFSQLSVKPNGVTPSYIYVDGTNAVDFFVTDDVHLEKNAVGATEASIYLRNGAQLLQGTGTTANTGDGLLSVYQTVPETSVYHYTFWNLPVSITSGSGNQNAGISRFYDCDTCGSTTTSATQVATTSGHNGSSTTSPITLSTRWIYKKLSSPDNDLEANWVRVNGLDNIEPHYGFIMKGVSNGASTIAQTYDFRGRPNKGDISVPVTAGTAVQRVLTGNPYPSAIDLKQFYYDTDNNEIDQLYFWDEPKNSEYSHLYTSKSGGWSTWVPGDTNLAHPGGTFPDGMYVAASYDYYSATGTGGGAPGSGPVVTRRFSPIGQGFEIRTLANPSKNPIFKNSHRVNWKIGTGSTFRISDGGQTQDKEEPTNGESRSSEEASMLRINALFGDSHGRQMLLALSDNSTKGYDRGMDAKSPMDAKGSEAYLPIEDANGEELKLVIQTLPLVLSGPKKSMIPITFKLDERMKIKVKAIEEVNFDHIAYLYDAKKDRAKQMSGGKTARYTLNAGTYKDRFYIVIANSNGSRSPELDDTSNFEIIEDLNDTFEDNLTHFQNNAIAQLELINPKGYNITQINLYDTAGKLIISEKDLGNSTKLSIPTHSLSDGIYLANVLTMDNFTTDFKILVINKK